MTDAATPETKKVPPAGRVLPPLHEVEVVDSRDVALNMRRVELRFPQGTGFTYVPGQAVVLFLTLADGSIGKRDYTILPGQAPDQIALDILLHGATPGPDWARSVKAGDRLELRGPRGKLAFQPQADWHLMSGDETCIPAFVHMLEQAPKGAKVHLFLELDGPHMRPGFQTQADLVVTWVERQGAPAGPSEVMAKAIADFAFPEGQGFAYVIGETSNVRRQRQDLIARGFDRKAIYSEGYWRPGRLGGHDHIED